MLSRANWARISAARPNRTGKTVEWKRAFLNGSEVQMLTNGVVWFQFYPTEKAVPNQTVELQINLKSNPMTPQSIEAETKDGQRVSLNLPTFSVPLVCLDAVTYSWDFRKAFVAYTFSENRSWTVSESVPRRVYIDGSM